VLGATLRNLIWTGLLIGVFSGLVPLGVGLWRDRALLAGLAFVGCVVGGILAGVLVAIPVAVISSVVLYRRR
jgi:hypothetical protein